MADSRARLAVKIVDPSTDAQQASVSAAGHLLVDVANVSDTTITVDTELSAAAALTDNFANPTVPGVAGFNMLYDGSTWDRAPGSATGGAFVQGDIAHDGVSDAFPLLNGGYAKAAAPADVSADGDAGRAWFLRNGAQAMVVTAAGALVGGDATNGLDVDVTRVTGTVTVDSELPAAGALADDTSNPTVPAVGSFLMGWDPVDSNWDRVKVGNDTGRLQVDVITGGGSDTPVNPVISYQTSAALAAGSAVALTTAEAASKKLAGVDVWASVPFKATLTTVDNAAESTVKGIGGGAAFQSWQYTPPHRSYIALGATAGLDAFRVNVTNLDNTAAADVYAVFYYED